MKFEYKYYNPFDRIETKQTVKY